MLTNEMKTCMQLCGVDRCATEKMFSSSIRTKLLPLVFLRLVSGTVGKYISGYYGQNNVLFFENVRYQVTKLIKKIKKTILVLGSFCSMQIFVKQ